MINQVGAVLHHHGFYSFWDYAGTLPAVIEKSFSLKLSGHEVYYTA